MADKPKDDGDKPQDSQGDDVKIPADGGSLPAAVVHRTDHSPMTKAE